MIDASVIIVNKLGQILHTEYDFFQEEIALPSITYKEDSVSDWKVGNTIEYATHQFQVTVWTRTIAEAQKYSIQVRDAMKEIGFKQISSSQLVEGGLIRKVLIFQGISYRYNK